MAHGPAVFANACSRALPSHPTTWPNVLAIDVLCLFSLIDSSRLLIDMRLVVRLDGANPQQNWRHNSASPPPSRQGASSSKETPQHVASFTIMDEDDKDNFRPSSDGASPNRSQIETPHHSSRLSSRNSPIDQSETKELEQKMRIHDLMDHRFPLDKAGYGINIDGPVVYVTPNDKKTFQQNKTVDKDLDDRFDNLSTNLNQRINNVAQAQYGLQNDLQRLRGRNPKHTANLQQQQQQHEQLKGRVIDFLDIEANHAQQTGDSYRRNQPAIGEFLEHLQQIASLRQQNNRVRRAERNSDSTGDGNSGQMKNFDGSFINVHGPGEEPKPIPSWHMPSWVTRQGYNTKQQHLLAKAQEQLTPILKQQQNYNGRPQMFRPQAAQKQRGKSPAPKRVSWSERVDSIAIPLQSNGDKPLRKPGKSRNRSNSPRRNRMGYSQEGDELPNQIRRSPRPGSSEYNILDRLAEAESRRTGDSIEEARKTVVPVSVFTQPISLATSGPFGAFPTSDDSTNKFTRSLLRSGKKAPKEEESTLRRWRSLEQALNNKNYNPVYAQVRHRAYLNGTNLPRKLTPGNLAVAKQLSSNSSNQTPNATQTTAQLPPSLGTSSVKLHQRQQIGSASASHPRSKTPQATEASHQVSGIVAMKSPLIINNSNATMMQAPNPVSLLRVSKVDPESYHVSLGIRLTTSQMNQQQQQQQRQPSLNQKSLSSNTRPNVISSRIGESTLLAYGNH